MEHRSVGVGFAISGPLFVIGSWLDDFIQSIAAALMIACTVWIATAARRSAAPARPAGAGHGDPAGSHPEVQRGGPAGVR